MTAIAVTIAGSDSGGGAGIQADLKTFSALGVYGASVVTAVTAQNTQGVTAIHDVPGDIVSAQCAAIFSDLSVNAVKIGMLSRASTIRAVLKALAGLKDVPVVLDPVMVATSGDTLLADDALDVLVQHLIPHADIITPNLQEAAFLTGMPLAKDDDAVAGQAARLLTLGARSVLLKGGHGTGAEARDYFTDGARHTWLTAPRHDTANTHGTGCTFAAISKGPASTFSTFAVRQRPLM